MKVSFIIKFALALSLSVVGVASFTQVAFADPTPSTNDANRDLGWAHVDQVGSGDGKTDLKFTSTPNFVNCFEYRTDGDTSQATGSHIFNPDIHDGLYPYYCQDDSDPSQTRNFTANQYIEVRMVFFGSPFERFDWTRFDVGPFMLMDAKFEVVQVLFGLLPTDDSKTDKRINKAIESIYKSLDPDFWEDGSHLTSSGNKVFDEEKKAVAELMKIQAGPAAVDDVIAALVAIDATLAQIALDEAIAGFGDPSIIAKAEKEMAKADDQIAKGKFDKAIGHFKKAWKNALKA